MNVMTIPPPREAALIRELREQAPRISVHEAARQTRHMFGSDGISESRWRQIEHGIRWFRGTPHPETGPAQTIARMALVVGGTPGQFREIGCDEIAAEMEALAPVVRAALTGRQLRGLARRSRHDASDELRLK